MTIKDIQLGDYGITVYDEDGTSHNISAEDAFKIALYVQQQISPITRIMSKKVGKHESNVATISNPENLE